MLTSNFKNLLQQWEDHAGTVAELVSTKIALSQPDSIKIEALAQLYSLSTETITAQLLQVALDGIEEQMPYVAGPHVIRVEEGDEIYEDIGPLPKYLALQQTLHKT